MCSKNRVESLQIFKKVIAQKDKQTDKQTKFPPSDKKIENKTTKIISSLQRQQQRTIEILAFFVELLSAIH